MSDTHGPVDPEIALEAAFQPVEDRLRLFDPLLRLRRSLMSPPHYVLERKIRRSRTIRPDRIVTKHRDRVIQARDGYVNICEVHAEYVHQFRLDEILADLRDDGYDLQGEHDAESAWRDFCAREQAERVRLWGECREDLGSAGQTFKDYYQESIPICRRLGDREGRTGRTRLNNAGGQRRWNIAPTPPASSGEIPGQERSEVTHGHETRTPRRQ